MRPFSGNMHLKVAVSLSIKEHPSTGLETLGLEVNEGSQAQKTLYRTCEINILLIRTWWQQTMIEHDLTPRKEVAKQHPDADKVHMWRKIVAIVKTTTVVSILISSSRPWGDSWMYPYQRNAYISPIWWVFIGHNPRCPLNPQGYSVRGTLLGVLC